MPFKFKQPRRHHIGKPLRHPRDWSNYSNSLKRRGDITIWLSTDAIEKWYESERIYNGAGAPKLYSDLAILASHEIRQVFKLPLRQTEGFINSLFALMKTDLHSPDYTTLSKRLKILNLNQPFNRKTHPGYKDIKAIAIDSSGLNCYGHDEWSEENYLLKNKKLWKKLHISVDQHHVIHSSELTDQFTQDVSVVDKLLKPIHEKINHFSADGAYDTNPAYKIIANKFPSADIVIPPQKDAVYQNNNEFYRNRNIAEIQCYGKIGWQKRRCYGRRNNSELAIQRYKRILGNRLHAREFTRQKQESIIGCSILNKLICISLAESRPAA